MIDTLFDDLERAIRENAPPSDLLYLVSQIRGAMTLFNETPIEEHLRQRIQKAVDADRARQNDEIQGIHQRAHAQGY